MGRAIIMRFLVRIFVECGKFDNMQSYKSALAAKVFSNVLHEGQTVSEAPSVEENQQVKETNSEKVDSPKQSTESEENLSPRVGRSH